MTLEDVEGKFRELTGTATGAVSNAQAGLPAIAIAIGAGAVAVIGVYFFGRRKGRKRATVLEIRRVV